MAATYQATGTGASGIGDVSVSWPTHATDDIGILIVECSNTGGDSEPSVTGWTKIFTEVVSTNSRLTAFYKRAASGSESSVTVPDTGDHTLAIIVTWRGCKTSGSPIDTYSTNVKSTASTSGSITGVTAAEGGNDVLYFTCWPNDIASAQCSGEANASLTSISELFDQSTTDGNGGGFAGWKGNLASAGASGTLTYTLVGSRQEIGACVAFLMASTGYTLAADQGSFTLSGQSADLLFGRVLSANHGSFSLAGQDAALLAARVITCDAGSFVLSGQDATLTYGTPGAYTLTADAGSFVLSGQSVDLLASRVVVAEAGVFVLSGQSATLLATRSLSADYGSFVLSGQAAILSYSGAAFTPGIELHAGGSLRQLHAGGSLHQLRAEE